MKKIALLFFALILGVQVLIAQESRITGIVKEDNGQPLAGVAVVISGTFRGTSTDVNGAYTIQAPQNGTLVFSFIGMKTVKEPVGNRTTINVTMTSDTEQIEDVVVVGYGAVKKSDLTGSVTTVTADKLVAKGTASVMGALQGSAPGVNISQNSTRPGAGYKIQIRGQNSIGGGNPLYVVDGIVTSDIDFLNPQDIERVDILKDASSTAIFGSRGSNGVVIVQTKSAQSVKSKISVSYDGYFGVRELARLPEFTNGRDWIDYRTSAYYTWNASALKYELLSNNVNAITLGSKYIQQALYDQNDTDWLGLATKTGSQQNHHVTMAGTSGGLSYNLGVGYQKEEGNFPKEQMERFTLKGSVYHKASNYFATGANFNLSHQIVDDGSQNGYRDFLRIPVVCPAYDEDGNLVPRPGSKDALGTTSEFTGTGNPLIEVEVGNSRNKRFDVIGSVFAELTPVKQLSLKTTFSPRLRQGQDASYYGRTSDRLKDQAQTAHTTALEWTWDNQVTFQNSWRHHNLNATGIASLWKSQSEMLQVGAEDFSYVSEWYSIFNGTLLPNNNKTSYSQTQLASFSARANYDYDGRYYITGTVRYDGSSKLGIGNKWALFPSTALAWRISNERWMENAKWIDNLKLRLSYGNSGNNNGVGAYGTMQVPNLGSKVLYDHNGNVVAGFGAGAPVNSALTWEKTLEWDFGVDFGVLRNRITASVDIYDKLSKGLIMDRLLTIESGASKMKDNIGSVNNRGVEVALTTQNIALGDWHWTTSFTFAANKNAIRELYGKKEDVVGETRFIGKPINVIYDYKATGIWYYDEWAALTPQQRIEMGAKQYGFPKIFDKTGEGVISTADRMILGQCDPKWTGGVTSTLSYKSIDFSFNVYASQGMFVEDRFLAEYGMASTSGNRGRPKVKQDIYVPAGVPRIDYSQWDTSEGYPKVVWGTTAKETGTMPGYYARGDFWGKNGIYQNSSFVKVRNITLGYTFPKSLIGKINMQSARLYMNVLNPFTFTKYVGWDPEYATTSLNSGNGPSTVTYQVGFNLKF